MSREQPPLPNDASRSLACVLAEGEFFGVTYPIYLTGRLSTERYSEPAEVNWFGLSAGERTHLTMHLYLLNSPHPRRRAFQPSGDAELDALFPPSPPAAQQLPIGHGSAWYYADVRAVLLYELYLTARFRAADSVADANLATLWQHIEALLIEQFPAAQFLMAPALEPLYDRDDWELFLVSQGYAPHIGDADLFIKLTQ